MAVGTAGIRHVHLLVADLDRGSLDDAITVSEAAGVALVDKGEHAPGMPYAYVRDPDGYVIEIRGR